MEDPREIVTAQSFRVAPELLGTPLASPRRRLAAVVLDAVFASLLAELLGGLVLVAAGLWCLWEARRGRGRTVLGSRPVLLGAAALFMLVGVVPLDDEGDKGPVRVVVSEPTEGPFGSEGPPKVEVKPRKEDCEDGWSASSLLRSALSTIGLSFGFAGFYFTAFTAWWGGHTPAKRLLRMRVVRLDGRPLDLWDSFGRLSGYTAGLATGLLGFAQVFWDPNRQAIQDKIAGTVVIRTNLPKHPVPPEPEPASGPQPPQA